MSIINIAACKFVSVADPLGLRERLFACCAELALKGTILLAPEGINCPLLASAQPLQRSWRSYAATPALSTCP